MEVREGYAPLARLVLDRTTAAHRPLVVGIAGGVAVGKSTAAAAVAELLAPRRTEVIATDGFLLPNAVLEAQGILHRKGFPESYDTAALEEFLDAIRRGDLEITAPVYSHATYDVVPGERRRFSDPDVLILEGVNALRFSDRIDLPVYLNASEAAMEEWYVIRFLELCADPPPGSFYEQFETFDLDAQRGLAADVWRGVNLVNLRDYIRPTLCRAQVVVEKRVDHTIGRVDVTNLTP